MLTTFDKALAAVLVPLIVAGFAHYGLNLSGDVQNSLAIVVTALITGLSVWTVPNKEK